MTPSTRPKESDIQKQILRYVELMGVFAWTNKTQGTFDPTRGRFRRGTTKKGVSDILGVLPSGRFLAIEVKRDKNSKPTREQLDFIQCVNEHGGLAFVAWSIDQVHFYLSKI